MTQSVHTIEVTGVPEETLRLLDKHILQQGGDRSAYIRELFDRELRSPTLTELLAPFRKQVDDSGMSEDELNDLFEEARDEVFQEKQARQQ